MSVFKDPDYRRWNFATEVWLREWWGVEPWSSVAYVWGDDRDRAALPWTAMAEERALGILFLNAFELDEARMRAFADRLERFRPDILWGYAGALGLFAAFLRERGGCLFRPRLVRSAAEVLTPGRRTVIEAVFGRRVHDFYGSRESANMAAECRQGRLHVLAHGKVLELVDEGGQPVGPGEPGRVLVTDLTNRAMGLIRYENGDVARWGEPRPCACGCPYPVLERVLGRTSDFFTTPDGRRIHGEWFTHLFYGVPRVRRFQVRQPARERIEVLVEGTIDELDMRPLVERMRERLGVGVAVTWRPVASIPSTETGKYRFTVSDVPYVR